MKKYALPLALAGIVALQACNQQSAPTPEAEVTGDAGATALETPEVAGGAGATGLETATQRLSYGIAYGLGARMLIDSVPMDMDAFNAGMRDALDGAEPRLTQEEIASEMQAYQEQAMAKQQVQQAAAGEANSVASAAFLAENAAREGVVVTGSGLQYEVMNAGDGATPTADDMVEVHYRGTLIDGTEFDSSYSRNQPATFGVTQVIPGWVEALQMMPVGSKWKLVIPADLAYGAGGAGAIIGPNATLMFEVELLSIVDQAAAAAEAAPAG